MNLTEVEQFIDAHPGTNGVKIAVALEMNPDDVHEVIHRLVEDGRVRTEGDTLYLNTKVYPSNQKRYWQIIGFVMICLAIDFIVIEMTPPEPDWLRLAVGAGYWLLCCWLMIAIILFGVYSRKKQK
jgi:hypothetical protein